MEIDEGLQSQLEDILYNRQPAQPRVKCTFPVFIEASNPYGEVYNGFAVVEDISRRGVCFKTLQDLTPGDRITIYKTDETDLIAQFEAVWVKSHDGVANVVGAQIIGDNFCWLHYLSKDLILLPGSASGRSDTGH